MEQPGHQQDQRQCMQDESMQERNQGHTQPHSPPPDVAAESKWSFPDAIPARRDTVSARIVQKSITLQQIHGTAHAVAFLKDKNIDLEIARRVLLTMPTYRRRDDLVDHLAVQAAFTKSSA